METIQSLLKAESSTRGTSLITLYLASGGNL